MSAKVTPSLCPWCGYMTDAATSAEGDADRAPKPSDFGICINCGAVNVYKPDCRPINSVSYTR